MVLLSLGLTPTVLWAQTVRTNLTPADVEKIVRNRGVSPIPSLALPVKINRVKELLGNQVPPHKLQNPNLSAPIPLTVQNSPVSDRAFLVFDFPESISAHENTALFSPYEHARLKIFFNAPTPGWYVFDYTIDTYSEIPFRFCQFALEPQLQQRIVKTGKAQHAIFVTQIAEPGWKVIFLNHSQGLWLFRRVEISQINYSNPHGIGNSGRRGAAPVWGSS